MHGGVAIIGWSEAVDKSLCAARKHVATKTLLTLHCAQWSRL